MTPQMRAMVPSWYRPPVKATYIERAAMVFGSSPAEMRGEGKSHVLCRPRWAVMLAMRRAGISYPRIGARLGGRDHSTIVQGVRRAEALLETDADFAERFALVLA